MGAKNIATRLDQFLVADNILILNYNLKSSILPWADSDNWPFLLDISLPLDLGPIAFQYSPQWLEFPKFLEMVSHSWLGWIEGNPIKIWESKICILKGGIKLWLKEHKSKRQINIKDMEEN